MRKCIYYFLFLSITFKKLVFSQNNSDGYFDVFPVKNSSVYTRKNLGRYY